MEKIEIYSKIKYGQIEDQNKVNLIKDYFKGKPFSFLQDKIYNCGSCLIRKEASAPVPPQGDPKSPIWLVGRNAGSIEDRSGIPFNPDAPAGKMLMGWLKQLDLKRSDCYISNAVFCHTERDRPPTFFEVQYCSLWKAVEFEFRDKENPMILITLGNDATRQLLGKDFPSILRVEGIIYYFSDFPNVYIAPLSHPGYCLRNYSHLKEVEKVLKNLNAFIKTDILKDS